MSAGVRSSTSASLPLHPYDTGGSTAQGPGTNLHANSVNACVYFSVVTIISITSTNQSMCTVLLALLKKQHLTIDFHLTMNAQSCDSFNPFLPRPPHLCFLSSAHEDGGEKGKWLVADGGSISRQLMNLNPSSRWRLLDIAFHSSC